MARSKKDIEKAHALNKRVRRENFVNAVKLTTADTISILHYT